MKFTQEDLLEKMGLKLGDKISVDDKYKDLFIGTVELNESSGAVGVRSKDNFLRLSEIVREGYEYYVITPPKYTLTETEKHIVLAIDNRWKWVARDNNGEMWAYSDKPEKRYGNWYLDIGVVDFELFNHHFQFIQWSDEEPVSLDELREIAKK